jgi:hypothetical protein
MILEFFAGIFEWVVAFFQGSSSKKSEDGNSASEE